MSDPVRTKEDVSAVLRGNGRRIRELGVKRLGLFGSFARNEQHPGSDVDVLVEFEPGKKSFDGFMGLAVLLEELFQRRVELVTPESLSPYIGPRILQEVVYVPLAA